MIDEKKLEELHIEEGDHELFHAGHFKKECGVTLVDFAYTLSALWKENAELKGKIIDLEEFHPTEEEVQKLEAVARAAQKFLDCNHPDATCRCAEMLEERLAALEDKSCTKKE